jgi:hypothetical protein
MLIGSRMLYPEEIDFWNAEIMQISVYCGMKDNLKIMSDCVHACRKAGLRYVIHPIRYSLLDKAHLNDILKMADLADLALILHDERAPGGERLKGLYDASFRSTVEKLNTLTTVSFENSTDTADVHWFWNNYAESITLDIGHVESAGLDSVEFVRSLDDDIIKKVNFVHMHRNNGLRGGITDHWPINRNSREIAALRELIKIKSDVSVILELNEIEEINESLDILDALRDELCSPGS